MKLFPKLTLVLSSLVIASIISVSVYFYWFQQNRIVQEAYEEAHRTLQNLVHIAQEAILIKDDLLLVRYTSTLPKWTPALVSASVVNQTGDILSHTRPEQIGHSQTLLATPDAVYLVSQPIRLGSLVMGTASVAFSKEYIEHKIHEELKKLRRHVLGVTGCILMGGILIAFVVALSLTRPIRWLSENAARVGQGTLSVDFNPFHQRSDELGSLSRTFTQMTHQLQELDQMKEDFVSAVTHELRSPLSAIESYLNVIEQAKTKESNLSLWERYGERLRVNTQRLNRFVNDLLDVAALDRGKVVLHRKPTSLEQVIHEVVEFFQVKFQEKDLRVSTDIAPALAPLSIDPDKIRQVLVNLISNAIKFTPEGGSLSVSAHTVNDMIRVGVRDSGIGISKENQERIFNKFEQVQGGRQAVKGPKGTGLGLSICKALVELHGGQMGVASEEGKGSLFYFDLPLEHAQMKEGALV